MSFKKVLYVNLKIQSTFKWVIFRCFSGGYFQKMPLKAPIGPPPTFVTTLSQEVESQYGEMQMNKVTHCKTSGFWFLSISSLNNNLILPMIAGAKFGQRQKEIALFTSVISEQNVKKTNFLIVSSESGIWLAMDTLPGTDCSGKLSLYAPGESDPKLVVEKTEGQDPKSSPKAVNLLLCAPFSHNLTTTELCFKTGRLSN